MKVGVVTGYLVDGEFTTRLNWDWQSPDETLPQTGVAATAEERQSYEDGEDDREVLRTTDGTIFLNRESADAHEAATVVPELAQVLELLEKAKVLAEANKKKSPALATILSVLAEVDGDGGEALMDKYHDSTCW